MWRLQWLAHLLNRFYLTNKRGLVGDLTGFEPATSGLTSRASTN